MWIHPAVPTRSVLRLLAVLGLVSGAGPGAGAGAAAGAEPATGARTRLNLVFLLTDDQRWDSLGCSGNPVVQTPEIDRLAAEGVRFRNAFVTTSICMTSRASILTGQYAARHGIWRFDRSFTPDALAGTYPVRLRESGYRVGFIGKWGVGDPPSGAFDYDRTFPGQGRYFVEADGERRHLTTLMGDQALEFLDGHDGRPFCLSVSFKAPHVDDSQQGPHAQVFPFEPDLAALYADDRIPVPVLAGPRHHEALPPFLQDSEARARWAVRFWSPARHQFSVKSYYRLISGVDRVVGRIRERLETLGLADDTVMVFTSDNGFYLGEYGLAGKWFPHDLSIRVPLIVRHPGLPAALRGSVREEMALNIDLAPTLLELAGAPVPPAMQGASLVPLIRGEDVPWRDRFFYEHLFEHPGIPASEAVRTTRWKYMRYVGMDPVHEVLHDLDTDPQETWNLAGEPAWAGELEGLRAEWRRLREAAR